MQQSEAEILASRVGIPMIDCITSVGMNEGWQLFGFAGLLFLALIGGAVALVAIRLIRTRALDQENRRLRTALNHMSQGLCMWSAETKLLLCNDRYIEMYGMSGNANDYAWSRHIANPAKPNPIPASRDLVTGSLKNSHAAGATQSGVV